MDKDWKGNKASTWATLGATNHSDTVREQYDFYATDPFALECLIKADIKFTPTVLEPSAGEGHLSRKLKEYGYEVISKDLIQRNFPLDGTWDFLTTEEKYDCDIVMNPPYSKACDFAVKALEVTTPGRSVWSLNKIQFLEGKQRRTEIFNKGWLKSVYVFTGRINCAKNGEFELYKSSAVCYCWMEFNKLYKDEPIIRWLN